MALVLKTASQFFFVLALKCPESYAGGLQSKKVTDLDGTENPAGTVLQLLQRGGRAAEEHPGGVTTTLRSSFLSAAVQPENQTHVVMLSIERQAEKSRLQLFD